MCKLVIKKKEKEIGFRFFHVLSFKFPTRYWEICSRNLYSLKFQVLSRGNAHIFPFHLASWSISPRGIHMYLYVTLIYVSVHTYIYPRGDQLRLPKCYHELPRVVTPTRALQFLRNSLRDARQAGAVIKLVTLYSSAIPLRSSRKSAMLYNPVWATVRTYNA